MRNSRLIRVGMLISSLAIVGMMSCNLRERESRNPTAPQPQGGGSSALSNYAQMEGGSTVVDGHQLNWVISDWGTLPYNQWMYMEVNEQDAIGKPPGDNQIPVTLGNVVLSFSGLPAAVREIMIGVKAVHDANDQTFIERGRFAVVDGRVDIPLDYGDLVNYFGVTHYSIWFQALGDANGRACGQIALSGVMPSGQSVTFSKQVCFGTNSAPVSTCPTVPAECVVQNTNDSGAGSLRRMLDDLGTTGCTTITFADTVVGKTITLAGTELTVANDVTIDGCAGVTISGNNRSRVFLVYSATATVTATLTGLTITGGRSSGGGGGIFNVGTLTLASSTKVSNNKAFDGGGIYNNGGILTVNGEVSNNTADGYGGGIVNAVIVATLTVNGTVSNNTAFDGGGIFNFGTLTVNGTVSNNTVLGSGGGIYNWRGTLTLTGSGNLIEGNHCDNNNTGRSFGGGIWTSGSCPAGANYGTAPNQNFRGSGTGTIDNCNGNP